MPRLPVPGSDTNRWGHVLNQYLRVAHTEDGSLRPIDQRLVLGLGAALSNKYSRPSGGIPFADLAGGVQTSLGRADLAVPKGDMAHNVKDFGATGNGHTDDTAAIRAAIDMARASTKKVYIPPGTYLITSALDVGGGPRGGLTVYGNGWDSQIKIASGADCYAFTFNNMFTPGAAIKDLTINCNGGAQTAGGGIDAEGACICYFERLHIDAPWRAGIYIHHDGTGGYGRQNVISSCHIENGRAAAGGPGYALLFEASDENRIVNCTFTDCGNTSAAENHMVYERAGLQMFHGNAFVGGATGCDQLKLESGNCVVVGNTFDGGNSSNQLRINGNANLVVGNRFHNVGSAAASGDGRVGVYLDNATDCLVAQNTIASIQSGEGFADSGVRIAYGAANNTVTGNIFTGAWETAPVNLSGAGSGNSLRANIGYNPQGALSAPAIPASGADFTHNFAVDCTVYISGGTVTDVAVGGTSTGLTGGTFKIAVGQKITLTYDAPPQWVWIGD